jgi:hypothetical protein
LDQFSDAYATVYNPPNIQLAQKSVTFEDRHMGYVNKGNIMENNYSISWKTWKWTEKLYFLLLDLIILNRYIIPMLGGSLATTAWCILRLWMERRPQDTEGSCEYIE